MCWVRAEICDHVPISCIVWWRASILSSLLYDHHDRDLLACLLPSFFGSTLCVYMCVQLCINSYCIGKFSRWYHYTFVHWAFCVRIKAFPCWSVSLARLFHWASNHVCTVSLYLVLLGLMPKYAYTPMMIQLTLYFGSYLGFILVTLRTHTMHTNEYMYNSWEFVIFSLLLDRPVEEISELTVSFVCSQFYLSFRVSNREE